MKSYILDCVYDTRKSFHKRQQDIKKNFFKQKGLNDKEIKELMKNGVLERG